MHPKPRLHLLKELLHENGSIFITIGDDEQHNLRCLLDEIFGNENFITTICWRRKVSPSNDAEFFSSDHDWLLVYAKNSDLWAMNRLPMNESQLANYSSSEGDERGPWSSGTYTCNKSREERPNLYYGIVNPNTMETVFPSETAVWKFSKETTEEPAIFKMRKMTVLKSYYINNGVYLWPTSTLITAN